MKKKQLCREINSWHGMIDERTDVNIPIRDTVLSSVLFLTSSATVSKFNLLRLLVAGVVECMTW